jgi:signal transduction histidine kinase
MAIFTSPEFMALCRAQLQLLSEGLGASSSVVYLTEEFADGSESKLTPIVVYPETSAVWNSVMTQINSPALSLPQNRPPKPLVGTSGRSTSQSKTRGKRTTSEDRDPNRSFNNFPRRQILLPLICEGQILGVLLTTRDEPPWNPSEQSEIQHIAQTIAIAGILDRRQQWLAIELQQQQQRQALQQDIVRNLLHQLRSPLTAIRTFGKLLIKRFQPEDPNQKALGGIVRESDRLQELLQHLELAMSIGEARIEASVEDDSPHERATSIGGTMPQLPPSSSSSPNLLLPAEIGQQLLPCQIADILTPLVETATAIAIDRGLELTAAWDDTLPLVLANPTALREVLNNPIDNALKYTPAGGKVEISVILVPHHQPPQLQISIRDNGLGIPATDLPRLFERNFRGVQARGTIPGTGLGLAIARELIHQMHGEIHVFSPPPDREKGTEFQVKLKLHQPETLQSGAI